MKFTIYCTKTYAVPSEDCVLPKPVVWKPIAGFTVEPNAEPGVAICYRFICNFVCKL